jgi:hypothetical protein
MAAGIALMVVLFMRLAPGSAAAQALHRWLVERPLELCARAKRRHLILAAILLVAGQSLVLAGSADLALLYAIDLSLYFDVVLTAWTLHAAGGLRAASTACKAVLSRPNRRGARARRVRRVRPTSNDNEGGDPFPLQQAPVRVASMR